MQSESGVGAPEAPALKEEILTYLANRPDAQDSLEGIVEWWLLQRLIERDTPRVRRALEELVHEGRLQKRRGSDGRTRYCLQRSREDG